MIDPQEQLIRDILFLLLSKQEEVCLSGGARGADSYWSRLWAKYRGKETLHYSFEGHNAYCLRAKGMQVVLSEDRLMAADAALKKAKKSNGRNYPCRAQKTNNLLRRNYYQTLHSDAMYAVSKLEYGQVAGGTNWATTMFIDAHMSNNPHKPCECYVYHMITDQWHQWIFDMWHPIEAHEVPTPTGIWTGIGSRDLTENAMNAMEALWLNTTDQKLNQ